MLRQWSERKYSTVASSNGLLLDPHEASARDSIAPHAQAALDGRPHVRRATASDPQTGRPNHHAAQRRRTVACENDIMRPVSYFARIAGTPSRNFHSMNLERAFDFDEVDAGGVAAWSRFMM